MSTPAAIEAQAGLAIENMTPRQIVAELDKYVVGQKQAKRAVAIALRNRWRRQQLPPELGEEIARESMKIANEICVFTNDRLTLEEL